MRRGPVAAFKSLPSGSAGTTEGGDPGGGGTDGTAETRPSGDHPARPGTAGPAAPWCPGSSAGVIVLVFGMLYPAYASYKAVKTKNIREYVRWMMYWIIFALFMATETFTDLLISWFPFYYEFKTAFVVWLLSPYTRGPSLLYRKFVHPTLSRKEKDIDACIVRTRERGYETLVRFGKRGLSVAATAAVRAATKSQGALAGRLRSFSMQDLRSVPDEAPVCYRDPLYLEEQESHGLAYSVPAPPRRYESETEDEELWSDLGVAPHPSPPSRDPKPLSRSQSLPAARKKMPSKEGSSRLMRSRSRKKAAPPEAG